jgi:hypothetical protein
MQKIKIIPLAADIDLLVDSGADRDVAAKFYSFISLRDRRSVSQTVAAVASLMRCGYGLQEIPMK